MDYDRWCNCVFLLLPSMTLFRRSGELRQEMAARLAKYFGTSQRFWLNLQDTFAIRQVMEKYSKELKAIKLVAVVLDRRPTDSTRKRRKLSAKSQRRSQSAQKALCAKGRKARA